jgi:hypothetical protein
MTVVAAIVSGADPGHYHGSMLCNRIRRGVRGSRVITEGAAQAQGMTPCESWMRVGRATTVDCWVPEGYVVEADIAGARQE